MGQELYLAYLRDPSENKLCALLNLWVYGIRGRSGQASFETHGNPKNSPLVLACGLPLRMWDNVSGLVGKFHVVTFDIRGQVKA